MPRSVFAYILTVLIAVATVGGFVCAAPHEAKTSQHPQGDWRILDPVVYENIAIFPVVSGSSQDTSSFLTLEEGLASGEVIVSERGAAGMVRDRGVVRPPQYDASASVNQLVLINRSKRPLLLLAGELVSGGKQDRIIGKDRIVPVGAEPLPLDVFCVEHGRWTGSSSQFTASKTIVHPSVREQAVEQKQDEVWAAIAGGTTASVTVSAEAAAAPKALSWSSVVVSGRPSRAGTVVPARPPTTTPKAPHAESSSRSRRGRGRQSSTMCARRWASRWSPAAGTRPVTAALMSRKSP